MYDFIYIQGAVIFLPLLFAIAIRRKETLKFIPAILIFALLAPITDFLWFIDVYWRPLGFLSPSSFVLQEILYVFAALGIGFFIYPTVFGKKIGNIIHWSLFGKLLLVGGVLVSIFLYILKLPSIWSLYFVQLLLAITLPLFYRRYELFKVVGFNFIIGSLLAFTSFILLLEIKPNILADVWLTENLVGIYIARVPLEEILWLGFAYTSVGLLERISFQTKNRLT